MPTKSLNERDTKLVEWLSEAHAKEAELEAALNSHISLTQKQSYKNRLRKHLSETKAHKRAVAARIKQLEELREEHVEIAIYTRLEAFATEVGDRDTAQLAKTIRRDEERMATFLDAELRRLVKDVVRAEVPRDQRPSSTRRRSTRRRTASRGRGSSSRSSSTRGASSRARTRS